MADGNTWNHEHIATIGWCLTEPEDRSYEYIRHLADYVLVWSGGGGDDLAKSPHMRRIANSVYPELCPGDPICSSFRRNYKNGTVTQKMQESLLYTLTQHNIADGVKVKPEHYEEAYTSSHGKVRIFKVVNIAEESKAFAADPSNWKCDAPGSWYCEGQYPPGLAPLLRMRTNFKQLEDFNAGTADKDAEEYQKAYHQKIKEREAQIKEDQKR